MNTERYHLPKDWVAAIEPHIDLRSRVDSLLQTVTEAYKSDSILPEKDLVFRAFYDTPYQSVKVVILGQDPYPTRGHAMGLSFSVPDGIPIARSLQNIYKERSADLGIPISTSGDLTYWAEQGVLLLNTILTVKEGRPESHKHIGWSSLTIPAIKSLNDSDRPIVYLLWGKKAQAYKQYIDETKHTIIESSHPSPLGATKTDHPFIGSRCFSRANDALIANGRSPIDWNNESIPKSKDVNPL